MHYLLKNVLSLLLFNLFIFLHQLKQIPSLYVLHHNQKMFLTLKNFIKSDYLTVPNFAQDINFLHYLLFAISILHVLLIDGLYSYMSSCKFVDAKGYLSKGAFSNQLYKFVKLEWSNRHCSMLLYVMLNVLDKAVSFHQYTLFHFILILCYLEIDNFWRSSL